MWSGTAVGRRMLVFGVCCMSCTALKPDERLPGAGGAGAASGSGTGGNSGGSKASGGAPEGGGGIIGGGSGAAGADSGTEGGEDLDSGIDGNDAEPGCPQTCPASAPVCSRNVCRKVIELALGIWHSCALIDDGNVLCWGNNLAGQLGDGTVDDRPAPKPVVRLADIVHIAAGVLHTCALARNGSVWCWGANMSGELGFEGRPGAFSRFPTQVLGIPGTVAQLGCGDIYTCARLTSGAAACWGSNSAGQLGIGSFETTSSRPVLVADLNDAEQIAVGDFAACARRAGGTLVCWGQNYQGGLGVGGDEIVPTPAAVFSLSDVRDVGAGAYHYCAVIGDVGAVECWGLNGFGEVGPNVALGAVANTPVPVGLIDARRVHGSFHWTAAVLSDGSVRSWGQNGGQLGTGSLDPDSTATPSPALLREAVVQLDSQAGFACALLRSGEVQCWGNNRDGNLGDGTRGDPKATPVFVKW